MSMIELMLIVRQILFQNAQCGVIEYQLEFVFHVSTYKIYLIPSSFISMDEEKKTINRR